MDNVQHPAHYQCGGIETIDVIRAKLGEGFGYYCEGNAIKYLTRWRSKGGVEDLRKASVYLGWLIEFEADAPSAEKLLASGFPLPPATAALIERAEAADDTHVGDLTGGTVAAP